MTAAPAPPLALEDRFARALPELAVPWQAEDAPDPRLVVLNEPLAAELGVDAGWLRSPDGVRFLVGTAVPDGARPVAQGYAGHQFGQWVPRLGDGRALLLGEVPHADGHPRDLHLKGSGRTPFARGGDGLAALGPMLREYVVSEAMHALGIPTTRSLAVVATGRPVLRETSLPGAVLARVASSHLRVGSFQYARTTGDVGLLRRLTDHAIERHHPAAADAERPALALLEAVVAAQASLVARWMLVGFVHGVMNTDNTTISGETIDYGPCAFLDAFDPAAVFSSIDHAGRYAYANQPLVAEWNLARLAETLLPLVDEQEDRAVELATEVLRTFRVRFATAYAAGLRAKLGLADTGGAGGAGGVGGANGADGDAVVALTDELLEHMRTEGLDHTQSFRSLSTVARTGEPTAACPPGDWVQRWRALGPDAEAMDRVNPVYVPRNHLVEEALDAADHGDLAPLGRLLEAVTAPFDERPGLERYAGPAPEDFGPYVTFCGT